MSGTADWAEDEGLEGETRTRDEDDGRETRAQDKNKNEDADGKMRTRGLEHYPGLSRKREGAKVKVVRVIEGRENGD